MLLGVSECSTRWRILLWGMCRLDSCSAFFSVSFICHNLWAVSAWGWIHFRKVGQRATFTGCGDPLKGPWVRAFKGHAQPRGYQWVILTLKWQGSVVVESDILPSHGSTHVSPQHVGWVGLGYIDWQVGQLMPGSGCPMLCQGVLQL